MATWPSTLPAPLAGGYAVKPVDQTVRTDMEGGAARQRRRTTARNDKVAVSWVMRDAQAAIFRAWFEDDAAGAAGGAAWFAVALLLGTGGVVSVDARFVAPPMLTLIGAKIWTVSGELEVR